MATPPAARAEEPTATHSDCTRILITPPLPTTTEQLVRELARTWISKRLTMLINKDEAGLNELFKSGTDRQEQDTLSALLHDGPEGQPATAGHRALVARTIVQEWGSFIDEAATPATPPKALSLLHMFVRAELELEGGMKLGAHLTLKDYLTFGAQFSRQPATQTVFGSLLIPALGQTLERDSGAGNFVASFVSSQPSHFALDYVHYLLAVGAAMRGMSSHVSALSKTLSDIGHTHPSGLVALRAQLATAILANQEGGVMSPVRVSNAFHKVRLPLPSEAELLEDPHINPSGFFFPHFTAQRVAPDTFGAFDSGGLCLAYAEDPAHFDRKHTSGWGARVQRVITVAKHILGLSDATEPLPIKFTGAAQFLSDSRINPFSTEESANNHALELAHLHHASVQQFFRSHLNIEIAKLPLRTQLHLVWYLEEKGMDGVTQLSKLIANAPSPQSYAHALVSALLITAHGTEWGDALLSISSKLSPKARLTVCGKIQEIAQSIDDIEGYIRDHALQDVTESQLRTLRQNLLRRTCAIVTGIAAQMRLEDTSRAHEDEILASIERAKKEVYLFGEACRQAKIDPADCLVSRFTILSALELTADQKRVLTDISRERCLATYGEGEMDVPFGEFQDSLSDPATMFYILEVADSAVAFMRANPSEKSGTLYLGSLNSDGWYGGYRFGMSLFDQVVSLLGNDYTLEGYVHEENAQPRAYYRTKGFIEREREIGADGSPTGYIRNERPAGSRANR